MKEKTISRFLLYSYNKYYKNKRRKGLNILKKEKSFPPDLYIVRKECDKIWKKIK